jgi:osmotically-inducible protein OsmY
MCFMKYFQTAAVLAAAALTFAGCKQQNQQGSRSEGQGGPSAKSEQDTIRDSARDAKKQISEQAKAQKEQVEAEAKAGQARIDAEKARMKAETNNAQQAVQQSTEKIRDAAGSASSKVQGESGSVTASSTDAAASPNGAKPSSNPATTDQSLTDAVKQALGLTTATTTTGQKVQVAVSNGTVTLSGTVSSEQEKSDMEKKARAIPGVTQVENQLQTAQQ